ncbi:MAG TPA: murein L,D-transpeptidase catalytic domain family protein [Gemmatimonadaceae bacterium]|nr:murein L,D-transpeptidase catalytic domain family protein [Gemmatimonadaceae bacterium]
MIHKKSLQNAIIGGVAVLFGGTRMMPANDQNGPVLTKAISVVAGAHADTMKTDSAPISKSKVTLALESFQNTVRPLSSSRALGDAFRSYFAYKSVHPEDVKKPYLYFVDYGLPSNTPRGYVFDMDQMRIVDGPFMVAHGRGSSATKAGVPTRFSNAPGSYATSLGLYLAQETYSFHGKTGGHAYGSVGLKLQGVSEGFNDNARERKVVAHGAPYVTPKGAGRSEGCPAMEQTRAKRLLPELANGGMVFLFAPDNQWLANDPWIAATATD